MEDEKKTDMPSEEDSVSNKMEDVAIAGPSVDEELGPEAEVKPKISKKEAYLTKLFGSDYNPTEVYYVLFAACLIALNSGFVNGVTMSGLLIAADPTKKDPRQQMVAGFAGAFTNTAIALVGHQWSIYSYHLFMILSYMIGAFIAAMISPKAKPYVIEPRYGPTFMIGGTMLLVASLLAKYEFPSRYVFFLVTASNGIQNGIASIYSANLIRCTLTGATTDIAIVIAQCINGNYKGFVRGTVLGMIVFFFWIGGIISYSAVRYFTVSTLMFNAALFYLVGVSLVFYLVMEVGVSLHDAIFGTWKWKKVLKKLDTGDGDLTKEKLMEIFDRIDQDGDNSGDIDAEELMFGLKKAEIKMKDYEMKTLFRAADDDGDGVITRKEWEELADKIL